MQFDIVRSFISKDVLVKAIDHTRTFVDIISEQMETILNSRKSLLLRNADILFVCLFVCLFFIF